MITIIILSPFTYLLSPLLLLVNQQLSPPLSLQMQSAALSVLRLMLQVQLSFVMNLLNVFLYRIVNLFVSCSSFRWPKSWSFSKYIIWVELNWNEIKLLFYYFLINFKHIFNLVLFIRLFTRRLSFSPTKSIPNNSTLYALKNSIPHNSTLYALNNSIQHNSTLYALNNSIQHNSSLYALNNSIQHNSTMYALNNSIQHNSSLYALIIQLNTTALCMH